MTIDALLCGKNGTDYLIEFKNGSVKKDEVLNKLYATLLMLQDVCELSVTDARKGLVFVLVYNGAKLGGQGANSSTPSKRVNDAPRFGLIRQGVTKHTGVNEKYAPRPVRGIGNSVKGIFVKDYIHCDKNDFEDILTDALS